ncbi:MAG: hypothetical protein ACQSGP_31005 [Frankia sp.]
MAGDIPGDEFVVVTAAGADGKSGTAPLSARASGGDAPGGPTTAGSSTTAGADGTGADPTAGRVIHRYGRLEVVAGPDRSPPLGPTGRARVTPRRARDLGETEQDGLTSRERLGLDARSLRDSDGYHATKAARPRAGEPWNMGVSCTEVVPTPPRGTPPAGGGQAQAHATSVTGGDGEAGAAAATPTSSYLEGSVAVGVIIVEGPTADLQFSAAERTKVVAEVQNGLSWYATTNPAADLTFTYDIQIVQVTVAPQPSASDLEAVWRNPAMASLGYAATFDGVYDYVDGLRTRLGTRWSYAAFFTKYPVVNFAYSAVGGPRLVVQYANDGWGPDNIDRVFAHETGHIFGCTDEYAGSGCDCGGSWGRFGAPNGNCATCAGTSVACLMKTNDFALCRFTPGQLGWATDVAGNPALVQSRLGTHGNFEVVIPSGFSGITHIWRNNGVSGTPWEQPFQTAWAAGSADALTMIFSDLANPGSLEVVARYGTTLSFLWRDGGPALRWRAPSPITSGAGGVPSMIQSTFGQRGNFELVSPTSGGGLFHIFRDNDTTGSPWSGKTSFGTSLGVVDAVSLVQSNLGGGSFEVAVRIGTRLVHIYRTVGRVWFATIPTPIITGVTGNPSMIQSTFGTIGNLELVVPAAGGGLLHVWRDNDQAGYPWQTPTAFGQSLGVVDAVSLIQSNLGGGTLEVVARVGERLYHFQRDATSPYAWHGPDRVL